MTEQDNTTEWDDARSLAAGSLTRRIHNGSKWFTVYLDRLAVEIDVHNVHWLDTPAAGRRYEPDRPFRVNGVALTRYQVISDDDPSLEIWVQLSAPKRPGERLRITEISFTGDDLTTLGLPMSQLRDACIYVGGVTGLFSSFDVTLPNGKKGLGTFYSITLDSRAVPFHRDTLAELTGNKRARRGSRMADETLRLIWDAMQEYDRVNDERRRHRLARLGNKREWVAQQTGQNVNNVQEQMTAAKRKYENTKQKRGKK